MPANAILHAALDCIILMDSHGRIVEFNPAAERTFGHARRAVIGQEMAALLVPADLRDAHRAGLANYLASGESRILGTRLEITALRADQTEFPVELTITRLPTSDGAAVFAGFLRDITQRRLDEQRLSVHHAVSHALVETGTVAEMAERVLSAIGENLQWEFGALWQADVIGQAALPTPLPPPTRLQCVAVWHRTGAAATQIEFESVTRALTLEPGAGIPGNVWEQQRPIWTTDVRALSDFPRQQQAATANLHACFAFPIRDGARIVGVIEFFSRAILPPDDALLFVVEVVGNEVGQFLRRKRLEEDLRTALARERAIADQLQDALRPALPEPIPELNVEAYYQAALDEASVGGDFYDVFALEANCHALVVADLSGKGLAAAAQTATVRHMLRTLLYQKKMTLADAMTRLNALLVEHQLLTGFSTLFVGVFDVTDRSFTYCSCGHETGLLQRAASGIVEEMTASGPVLGIFPEVVFTERRVSLSPGDVIALFTDGLTEAGTNRRELLGVDGVARILSGCAVPDVAHDAAHDAARIVRCLMSGVTEFAGASGLRDDVCLLIAVVPPNV